MIRPLGKYLLVKRVKTKVDTGIILPDSVKSLEEDMEFTVEAVGDLCELGLEVGESLIFRSGGVSLTTVDADKDLHIVPESFIIGVK
jgi:co-chaperonin GroES (HSP10)